MAHPISDFSWRESSQPLLPASIIPQTPNRDIYNHIPSHSLGNGKIFEGYASLISWISEQKAVVIDGYVGVFSM